MAEKGPALAVYWRKLSKRERVIISLALIVAVSFLIYQYLYTPQERMVRTQHAGIAAAEKEILELRVQLAELKVRAAEFKAGSTVGPDGWDLIDRNGALLFLEDVWGEAKRAGVNLTSVHPSQELDKENYKEVSMNLDVKARYRELAQYFKRLEGLSRIVNIRKIRVESCPDSASVCAAQFEAVTYMTK